MSLIESAAYEQTDRLDSAATASGIDFVLANQSGDDKKMTITQLSTFMTTNLGSLTIDNITLDGNTVSTSSGDLILSATSEVDFNSALDTSGVQIKPGSDTLAFAATVTMDCNDGNVFDLVMTSNATLSAINLATGAEYKVSVAQNATTSSNTLAYASLFEFEGGSTPVLSLASAAKDTLTCYSPEGTTLRCTLTKDFS